MYKRQETLALVRRGDQGGLERSFADSTAQISAMVTKLRENKDTSRSVSSEQLDAVSSSLEQWKVTDAQVRGYIQSGDFGRARVLTVGDTDGSSGRSYEQVDAALTNAITSARDSFRDDINTAQRVLGFTGTGILMLTLFAAVAVVIGLIPRIREYR